MLGFRYLKVSPTTYVMLYRQGKVVREGLGLSFFYFAPTASIVQVAVSPSPDLVVTATTGTKTLPFRNPPHVHQPLIQTIVDELRGRGRCQSTGESAARTSWVMDRCLDGFYQRR